MKKLLLILTKRERVFFVFLVFGMFLTMFFELLGLSLVVPLAYSLTEEDIFEKYDFLESIQQFLNYPSNETIIFLSLIFFLLIYVVKNIYKIMNLEYVEDFHRVKTENEEITSMEANINYSKVLLDWRPRISFENGLESTVKWTLSQIGRFYD